MSKTLGILTGKKREYNGLILKSLVTGAKKTIQIAKYIHLNQDDAPVKANYNEVRQINSIICRKKSRLQELSDKGYIKKDKDLWKLEAKGTCVALTLFNDFGDLRKLVDFEDLQPKLKSAVQKAKKNPIITLIFTKAVQNIINEEYDKMVNNPKFIELFLFKLRAFTEELIREGVDIDAMSNRSFRINIGEKMSSWAEE
jgi:hypothetical protein